MSNTHIPAWSDGCSGWINGFPWKPDAWLACCVAHDWSYRIIRDHRADGTWGPWRCALERRVADFALGGCVSNRGYRVMGVLMAVGVRSFGWLPAYFGRNKELVDTGCDDCRLH
jgi:hypothetical protein